MSKNLKFSLFLILLLSALAGGVFPGSISAQDQAAAPQDQQPPPTGSEEAIQANIDELEQRIKTFTEAETAEVAQALNVTPGQLRERTETLRETRNYYIQQLQALHKHKALLLAKEELLEEIATGEALKLEAEPPYSLKVYDDCNARYADSKRDLDTAQLALAVARNTLQDSRKRLDSAATRSRALKEAKSQSNQQETLRQQWLLEKSKRQEALAVAVLAYWKQTLANAEVEKELAALKLDLAGRICERIRENLHFDQGDLEEQLAAIDEYKQQLQIRIESIRNDLRESGRKVLKARSMLEQTGADIDLAKARTNLAVAEQWQQTYRVMLEQAESTLQQLETRKQLWQQRYDLIKDAIPRSELADLRQDAERHLDRLRQTIALEQERQTNLQLQISKLEERLQQEGWSWGTKSDLNEHHQALREQLNRTIEFLNALNRTLRMNLQFIEEADLILRTFALDEKFETLLVNLESWWNTELLVVDDQALTVRKVVIALGILIFGIIIAGIFSRLLHHKLSGSFSLSNSAVSIITKLIKYTIILIVVFFAMSFVNIPLTVFTFMGGAIALGVGFGAKELINNFISGFILMVEQPVRVGDLVMVDNEAGWIEDIGARSTRVRTYSNIHILVPNSYFLENNIINWTHNDNLVRGQVVVGVAYGSPTREVKAALLQAAAEHGEVRKDPEPYVWFADFGDNSLVFELFFWVVVTENAGIQRVSSDLRYMIDQLFREAGISIAFPQRDLHFDRDNPLKVEISRPGR